MKYLDKLPKSKFSLTALSVGLVSGMFLTAVNVADHQKQLDVVRNTSAQTSQEAAAAADEPTTPETPADGTESGSGGNTGTTAPSTGQDEPETPLVTEPEPTPPVPITVVDKTITSVVNGDQTEFTCHFAMSDGNIIDKFVGSVATKDVYRTRFACPQP